jgi:hypothetical protein
MTNMEKMEHMANRMRQLSVENAALRAAVAPSVSKVSHRLQSAAGRAATTSSSSIPSSTMTTGSLVSPARHARRASSPSPHRR